MPITPEQILKLVIAVLPGGVASTLVTGIGFLGARVILPETHPAAGLAPAAAIWLSAANVSNSLPCFHLYPITGIIHPRSQPCQTSHYQAVNPFGKNLTRPGLFLTSAISKR